MVDWLSVILFNYNAHPPPFLEIVRHLSQMQQWREITDQTGKPYILNHFLNLFICYCFCLCICVLSCVKRVSGHCRYETSWQIIKQPVRMTLHPVCTLSLSADNKLLIMLWVWLNRGAFYWGSTGQLFVVSFCFSQQVQWKHFQSYGTNYKCKLKAKFNVIVSKTCGESRTHEKWYLFLFRFAFAQSQFTHTYLCCHIRAYKRPVTGW